MPSMVIVLVTVFYFFLVEARLGEIDYDRMEKGERVAVLFHKSKR